MSCEKNVRAVVWYVRYCHKSLQKKKYKKKNRMEEEDEPDLDLYPCISCLTGCQKQCRKLASICTVPNTDEATMGVNQCDHDVLLQTKHENNRNTDENTQTQSQQQQQQQPHIQPPTLQNIQSNLKKDGKR